jgi:hypothetical protein
MIIPPDFRSEFRWLSSGFLLMLYSGFGQTYFIAIFAGNLKADLAISNGEFGSLYALGTLASAGMLAWAGKLADAISIRWLGAAVIAGLAVTCFAMASVQSPLMLAVVLFGLRFFGQGMLTHTAMTAMGRWFNRKRGRAVSIAVLGLPARCRIQLRLARPLGEHYSKCSPGPMTSVRRRCYRRSRAAICSLVKSPVMAPTTPLETDFAKTYRKPRPVSR